jgi:uroporphyrinogen-III decarboxylase
MANTWKDPDLSKSGEQLYAERCKRMEDAIALRQPDRIPTEITFGHFLAEYGGITRQEMFENPAKSQEILEKAARYVGVDAAVGAIGFPAISKILGDQMTKWPGYGLGPNGNFQFNEHEFMKAEDYDAFLEDPSDWAIRKYLPRVFTALQGFALLPPLAMFNTGYYHTFSLPSFAIPPVAAAFEALHQAIQTAAAAVPAMIEGSRRMAKLGFAPGPAMFVFIDAPFDFMSDTLRGMRGIFLDMKRSPEKLLAAEEKALHFLLDYAISAAHAMHAKEVFIPLHRGSDGFMSFPQFETFYWPTLKAMVLALIDAGLTPLVYYEGVWDQRLHYLAELPRGKTIGMFQDSNIFKVKEVLGDTLCIFGGMPVSMLRRGSPDAIRDLTKRLCKEVGKGGGFIMSSSIGELEGCDIELVKTWMDATKEFGTY